MNDICNFLAIFMKMLIRAFYEALVIVAKTKGVPRQRIRKWCHSNISVPVAHGDTGAKGKVTGACKNGGLIPVTGFPHVGDKAKEGQRAPTIRAWSKHEHLIHHTCIRSRAVVSGLYLRSVRYRSGSSLMLCTGSRRFRDVRSRSSRSRML